MFVTVFTTAYRLSLFHSQSVSAVSAVPLCTAMIYQQAHVYLYQYVHSHIVTSHQHVSVIAVTFIRVSYSKNTVNVQYKQHSILHSIFYDKSLGHRASE